MPGGTSAYFRLTTRPVAQDLAGVPLDSPLLERRRSQAVGGGYRRTDLHPTDEHITLVGVGAMMPDVVAAAELHGIDAGSIVSAALGLLGR